jgi:hypothetical protein
MRHKHALLEYGGSGMTEDWTPSRHVVRHDMVISRPDAQSHVLRRLRSTVVLFEACLAPH